MDSEISGVSCEQFTSTANVDKLEIGGFDNISYLQSTHRHVTVKYNPKALDGVG